MRISARFLFCLVFLFLASFFVTTQSFAQTTTASSSAETNYNAPNTNPDVPKNLHTWTQNVMIETMSAVICQVAGVDPTNPNGECLGVDPQTHKIGFVKNGGGAIGLMSNAITMLYTPPIDSREYYSNLATNFGLAKNAYAEQKNTAKCNTFTRGTGFCGLTPLMGLWTAMKNIVYLLFVIVFVVIGFAIMLRIHIDPRTVMTIQNQIPKIIVGILLVTFSFAIAGFLIDVMYTSIYLIGNEIVRTDPQIANSDIVRQVSTAQQPFEGINDVISVNKTDIAPGLSDIPWQTSLSIGGFVAGIFDNPPGRIITGAIGGTLGYMGGNSSIGKSIFSGLGLAIGTFVAPGIGSTAGLVVAQSIQNFLPAILGGAAGAAFGNYALGTIGGTIAFLIVSIAILTALFRLWITLIKAYLFFIINVVFAPFSMLLGLFPGASLSFGTWMREIISDLAVFPATIVLFLMARVFMDQFASAEAAFAPPMIANFADPKAFSSLIGMGMVLLTPAMLDKIKDAIKAPKVDLTPIYKALNVGTGAPTGIMHGVGSFGLTLSGMKNVPFVKNLPGIKDVPASGAKHG